jgi:glycylpeptide N-tetradecanoyltransferase
MVLSRRQQIAAAESHKFWDTQPMRKEESADEGNGPIEVKTVDEVNKEGVKLPEQLAWCEFDVDNPVELQEVYTLLAEHYVEDDDNMFRFNYSVDFLKWALKSPGWIRDWHLGIRARSKEGVLGRMLAIITAIPVEMNVYEKHMPMVEINFLCVHQKLRSKRLAPALIKEITRRVNLRNIWQATYTAGVVLPSPVARCRYYHRSLNPKKLIEVGFSHLAPRMTMARTIKLYALADAPSTPGLRPMEPRDVPAVGALLRAYLGTRKLHPTMSDEETAHWLLPRPDVVYSYVVERDGRVTDVGSFYCLPSTIISACCVSRYERVADDGVCVCRPPQVQHAASGLLVLQRGNGDAAAAAHDRHADHGPQGAWPPIPDCFLSVRVLTGRPG